jgi:hypothetical protein
MGWPVIMYSLSRSHPGILSLVAITGQYAVSSGLSETGDIGVGGSFAIIRVSWDSNEGVLRDDMRYSVGHLEL